jgi:Swiss Army Knife protein, DSP-PTPase phosphatase domain
MLTTSSVGPSGTAKRRVRLDRVPDEPDTVPSVSLELLTYLVAEGFRAGAYPGVVGRRDPAACDTLESSGVTLFVDLTEDGELPPYWALLARARHVRLPITDMGVTTPTAMTAILDRIDAERRDGGTAYVHCYGGIGRTGTVVGCWLRRHGLDEGDPIALIAALRQRVDSSWMRSPQTDEQRAVVRGWAVGR